MDDSGKTSSVLYVDWAESNRKAFRLACQDTFRVITVESTTAALESLNDPQNEIGVLVVARCMPHSRRSDSFSLLQQVRDAHPAVVRLLASDGCSEATDWEATRVGLAERVIPLPWEPPELKSMLFNALEHFAAQRHPRAGGKQTPQQG